MRRLLCDTKRAAVLRAPFPQSCHQAAGALLGLYTASPPRCLHLLAARSLLRCERALPSLTPRAGRAQEQWWGEEDTNLFYMCCVPPVRYVLALSSWMMNKTDTVPAFTELGVGTGCHRVLSRRSPHHSADNRWENRRGQGPWLPCFSLWTAPRLLSSVLAAGDTSLSIPSFPVPLSPSSAGLGDSDTLPINQ